MPMGHNIAPNIAGIRRNSGFLSSSSLFLPRRNKSISRALMGLDKSPPTTIPTPRPMKDRPTYWIVKPWWFMKTSGKASKKRYRIERRKAVYRQRRKQIGSRERRRNGREQNFPTALRRDLSSISNLDLNLSLFSLLRNHFALFFRTAGPYVSGTINKRKNYN